MAPNTKTCWTGVVHSPTMALSLTVGHYYTCMPSSDQNLNHWAT